jgi:hypothetical protein
MRVMMMHGELALDARGERHSRASVVGMQIVCDGLRGILEDMFHLRESLFEELHRRPRKLRNHASVGENKNRSIHSLTVYERVEKAGT